MGELPTVRISAEVFMILYVSEVHKSPWWGGGRLEAPHINGIVEHPHILLELEELCLGDCVLCVLASWHW